MPQHFLHLDSGDTQTTESFFSSQLIHARVQGGMESNQDLDPIFDEGRTEEWLDTHWREIRNNELKYDEDVNQYLTLTLADLVNPRCLERVNDCLVGLHADVGQRAVCEQETSKRYFLYKTNADFLLLHLGLFASDTLRPSDAYFDKGEAYYFSAAANLKGMKRGRSALSDVLEKLSCRFGRYVEILRLMKQHADNYLSFHFRITQADMERLEHALTLEMQRRREAGSGPRE